MPRIYRVIMPVPQLDEAARFYRALFGVDGEQVSVDRHYFNCGGVILACVATDADSAQPFRPNPDYLYLAVDHLEHWLERARASGSVVDREIASYPWGERSFYYIHDPFGNPLCFVDEMTRFSGGRFVD